MTAAVVTLVTTSSCHLCEDAKAALAEFESEFGLVWRDVDASTPEGWALLAQYRPALLPLLALNGEMFSVGRLPRKKLRRALERLPVAP